MKRRICVKSMVLGAVIMLIGMWVSPLISPPVTAQHNGVFGDIQCTSLTVVDGTGEPGIELRSKSSISTALMGASVNQVVIYNRRYPFGVVRAVSLSIDENGGRVDVYDDLGKNRAVMGVNQYGNGTVSTWDKSGYRQ